VLYSRGLTGWKSSGARLSGGRIFEIFQADFYLDFSGNTEKNNFK